MRPGDIVTLTIYRQTAAEAPSTGKVIADFAFEAWQDGVLVTLTKTLTELASTADGKWRAYKLAVTLPSSAGFMSIRMPAVSGTDVVFPALFSGEIEANDIDSLYAVSIVTTVNASATGGASTDTPLTFNAYRYHDCTANFVDQAGSPVDLSGYNNARFSVWDRAHSVSPGRYTLSSGITMSALGVIAWSVPEDAAFFAYIDAAIAASQDTVTLYYDLVADKAATATKSVPLLRGTITLNRFEAAP